MPNKYVDDIADMLKQEVQQVVDFINSHEIEIGVVDGSKASRKARVGINNAELMFIHENGSPLRNIPARPVLEMTIQYTIQNLLRPVYDKCIDGVLEKGWTNDNIVAELNKLCMRMQNYARKIIYDNDGRLAPNAPSTRKAKAKMWHVSEEEGNHPLFMTGQLARSITCRLVEKSNSN